MMIVFACAPYSTKQIEFDPTFPVRMWIFAYGSLMWDDWEAKRGCTRRVSADLPGYRRTFNKASIRNWGSKSNPCPTLIVEDSPGVNCRGIAFQFPDSRQDEILNYLRQREGKNFKLPECPIRLEDGSEANAHVAIYSGHHLLSNKSVEEKAHMVRVAVGTDGKCVHYVERVAQKLSDLGIEDPEVRQLLEALQSH